MPVSYPNLSEDPADRLSFPKNPGLCLIIKKSAQTTRIKINSQRLQVSLHACLKAPWDCSKVGDTNQYPILNYDNTTL